MRILVSQKTCELFASVLIILFVFFIPISPTIKSILLVCCLVTIFLSPDYRKLLYYSFNTLWGWTALAFFGYIVIACLWSPAPYSMQWAMVAKYTKLLLLPILAVGFINPKVRHWSLNAYLASISVTCILSILKDHNIVGTGDVGEVFYNHIVTGFMVAFASYLAALFALQYKGLVRSVYLFICLISSYQVLFINTGRTGYIIYFILMVFLILQKLSLKKALMVIFLFIATFALAYQASNTMQIGLHALITEVKLLQQNQRNTSIGYRVQFHDYASSLLHEHQLSGVGTGGFKYRFSQDNPIPVWGSSLSDPHSQYWMILAEQGIIGFIFLLFFLTILLISSFQLKENRAILMSLLIAFCLGSVTDTFLCYSTAGYLLVVISALCFGELLEKRILKAVTSSNAFSF